MSRQKNRCAWPGDDPLYLAYHDREWGVPLRNDQTLFEFLVLEGAQAGLSWITILKRRDSYRRAFREFEIERVARITPRGVERLLQDEGIIRNRAKVEATVRNARAALAAQEEHGSFASYLWRFVDGRPVQNRWRSHRKIPAETVRSRAMSKALQRDGFSFVGPTICYAFMQATGMVNDHVTGCFRYEAVRRLGAGGARRRSRAR